MADPAKRDALLGEILASTQHLREMYWTQERFPGMPLFSGGILDAWPAVALDALEILREEFFHINAEVAALKRRGA